MVAQDGTQPNVRQRDRNQVSQGWDITASSSAIACHGHDKPLLWVKGAVVPAGVSDSLCIGIDQVAILVESGRNADIDLVLQPEYHIAIMSRKGRVEQRSGFARFDLCEQPGGHFQPVQHVCPGQQPCAE
nr:hypothetical protein [Phaeobacter marinintestinus]